MARRILVTGGTGTLGRRVTRELAQAGVTVRVLTRSLPAQPDPHYEWAEGDYVRGAGLAQAFEDVDAVLHTAHDPQQPGRDLAGVARLHSFSLAAGIRHFTQVGIVGVERMPGLAYYAAKARAEELLRRSGLPASVFRATQFHPFVHSLLSDLGRLPLLPVPQGLLQPVDVDEVAAALAEHVLRGQHDTESFAGPQVLSIAELAGQTLAAAGQHKRVVSLKLPVPMLRALHRGVLTDPGAARGKRTFAEWLATEK
ncbi:SDR family oxidoreductase [Deinococcus frigens]|uniref:SDR family oxidoreductase n=1 Tax=Deinococcus frigens TaxID=249403 RepID=UPI0004972CD4|nr:NAD(P)H-binding protein [Deinococcus frigens]